MISNNHAKHALRFYEDSLRSDWRESERTIAREGMRRELEKACVQIEELCDLKSTDILAALRRFKTWSLIREEDGTYTCYIESEWTTGMARDLMDYKAKGEAASPLLAIQRAVSGHE